MGSAAARERGALLLARLILASRAADSLHRTFDRARSRAVVRWADDAVLAAFNDLTYRRDRTYVTGSDQFRGHLFPWEHETLRRHFPTHPSRLLVGGAGGGREAFALAAAGHDVVAFEPAAELAAGMAERAARGAAEGAASGRVRAFRARYEDLPRLAPARPGDPGADLGALGRFDGAVMGWGSFSHLPTESARIHALRALGEVVEGPLLVSFLDFSRHAPGAPGDGSQRGEADHFSVHIGYYHTSDPAEVERLARAAGLRVLALLFAETETSWPHAVLVPRVSG